MTRYVQHSWRRSGRVPDGHCPTSSFWQTAATSTVSNSCPPGQGTRGNTSVWFSEEVTTWQLSLQNCNVAHHVSDTVLAHQAAHVSVLPNYRETSPPAKNYRNSRTSSSSSSFTSLSSLTIVLAVLGSIVLVLVSILIVLLCRTSGSNKSDDKNAKIIFVWISNIFWLIYM